MMRLGALLFPLLISLIFGTCFVSRKGNLKITELKQLANETPVYPDFELVDSTEISKSDTAVLAYFYRSSASYEEVKGFYSHALLVKGWSSPVEKSQTKWLNSDNGSRRLTFKKGEYFIDVEYDTSEVSAWRFAVDYGWREH